MRYRAHGRSRQELFENAAQELISHLINPAAVGQALREKVVVEAATPEQLLRGWLMSLVDLLRAQRMIFGKFHVQTFDRTPAPALHAEVLGELLDPHRHVFLQSPEKLTCASARITQDPQGYHAEIEFI